MLELSKRMKISDSYISLLESGDRQPSREMVIKLAEALFPTDNETVRDELLILAGFMPLNPDKLLTLTDHIAHEQNLEKNRADFKTYLTFLINLIKQGHHADAKIRIEHGLQQFKDSFQLQTLLAYLELANNQYQRAIIAQETALKYYELESTQQDEDWSDLLLNLGVMYFLKAESHLIHETDSHERSSAINDLKTARSIFRRALELSPQNVYLLDESARVHFNLADLSEEPEATRLWQETIAIFKQILYSDRKQELGDGNLIEVGAYLAHTYSKTSQFDEAEYLLQIMTAYCPHHWLVYYVQACFYNLKYDQSHQGELLEKSLKSLEIAVKCSDPRNRSKQQALNDPDLDNIRRLKSKSFIKLIHLGGK